MLETPQEFYERALASADVEGRLPLPDQAMWEIFRFEPESLLGRLVVRITWAVESLEAIGRVPVNKWGDGGSHLHVFLLGRPAGLAQLRGSNLATWEEMFPRQPAELAAETLQVAVDTLVELGGRAQD